MRTFFMLSLGISLIACEPKFSQDSIAEPPVLDEYFLSNSLSALETSLQQHPSRSELYFQKASLLYYLDQKGSLQAIDQALRLNSSKADYYLLKALIHKKDGQQIRALESAQQAERLGGNKLELFGLMAELHADQGNFLETLNYSNQVIKVNSSHRGAMLLKSKALLGLQDTVGAEYFLRKALDNDPEGGEGYILALRIFMARLEYDTALVLLQAALALEPDNPELVLQTGEWLEATDHLDSAEGIWHRLSSNPEFQIHSWRSLASLKFDQGQYDSAGYYSNMILTHNAGDLAARLTLARAANRQGNSRLAIDEYEEILASDSTHQTAKNELEDLNRKVAYLQRIRLEFEKHKAQISTITPKKPVQEP